MFFDREQFMAAEGVPNPGRLIVSGGGDPFAIGRERHRGNRGTMAPQCEQLMASGGIPNAGRLIQAAARDSISIRAVGRLAAQRSESRPPAKAPTAAPS